MRVWRVRVMRVMRVVRVVRMVVVENQFPTIQNAVRVLAFCPLPLGVIRPRQVVLQQRRRMLMLPQQRRRMLMLP